MKTYSKEFKAGIIAKLLPPNNASVPDVARETGIPKDTLYSWRIKYNRSQGATETIREGQSAQLNGEEKLDIVIETASLTEIALSEYCRSKGLYPEQIAGWKKAFSQSLGSSSARKAEREELQRLGKLNKELERELQRKEKALAEAAALLVLKKKLQLLWEEPEAVRLTSRNAKR